MTPMRALLPHESVCTECDDGMVPIMVPGRDEMLYTGRLEACERCGGCGVIANERRDHTRPVDEVADAFRELRAAWMEQALARAEAEQLLATERATVRHQADQIDWNRPNRKDTP